jgi:heme exporter protein D
MNYEDLETLFRGEQEALRTSLYLQPEAIEPERMQKHWKHIKMANWAHKAAGFFSTQFIVLALVLAWFSRGELHVSLPLLAGALALLLNYFLLPLQFIQEDHLERFSTRELAESIRSFNRYMVRRFRYDAVLFSPFMLSLYNWHLNTFFGINPFLAMNDGLAWKVWSGVAAITLLPLILSWWMTVTAVKDLGKLEESLRGYTEDELV